MGNCCQLHLYLLHLFLHLIVFKMFIYHWVWAFRSQYVICFMFLVLGTHWASCVCESMVFIKCWTALGIVFYVLFLASSCHRCNEGLRPGWWKWAPLWALCEHLAQLPYPLGWLFPWSQGLSLPARPVSSLWALSSPEHIPFPLLLFPPCSIIFHSMYYLLL